MGLILIVIGAVSGWRSGRFYGHAYAIFAVVALVVGALALFLEAGGSAALLRYPILLLSASLVAFVEIAGAYTLFAWLKAKRIENRGE
jgi:hypothetical protein